MLYLQMPRQPTNISQDMSHAIAFTVNFGERLEDISVLDVNSAAVTSYPNPSRSAIACKLQSSVNMLRPLNFSFWRFVLAYKISPFRLYEEVIDVGGPK
ncbi:hypothetical protein Trydic_g18950 [Trypoxylus dichotomus]